MGGAFGGKETQGNRFAVVAALVAKEAGRAAKIRPDRDDDFVITGKRHDFLIDYDVGFDDAGRILAVDMTYAARRSEEHTSELQSLMRISYAVFCLQKKKDKSQQHSNPIEPPTTTA